VYDRFEAAGAAYGTMPVRLESGELRSTLRAELLATVSQGAALGTCRHIGCIHPDNDKHLMLGGIILLEQRRERWRVQ
jgi:hypothetical protein